MNNKLYIYICLCNDCMFDLGLRHSYVVINTTLHDVTYYSLSMILYIVINYNRFMLRDL